MMTQKSRIDLAPIPDADLPQLREVLAAISDCAITIYLCEIMINPRIVYVHAPSVPHVAIRHTKDGKYSIDTPHGVQSYDDANHSLRHIRAEVRSAMEQSN